MIWNTENKLNTSTTKKSLFVTSHNAKRQLLQRHFQEITIPSPYVAKIFLIINPIMSLKIVFALHTLPSEDICSKSRSRRFQLRVVLETLLAQAAVLLRPDVISARCHPDQTISDWTTPVWTCVLVHACSIITAN